MSPHALQALLCFEESGLCGGAECRRLTDRYVRTLQGSDSDEVCAQMRLALHTKLDLYVSLTLERNNTDA